MEGQRRRVWQLPRPRQPLALECPQLAQRPVELPLQRRLVPQEPLGVARRRQEGRERLGLPAVALLLRRPLLEGRRAASVVAQQVAQQAQTLRLRRSLLAVPVGFPGRIAL